MAIPAYRGSEYVGSIRVPEAADPDIVIREFVSILRTTCAATWFPTSARTWAEVHRVRLPRKEDVPVIGFADLPSEWWEDYTPPRVMPILDGGLLIRQIVVPFHESLAEAQARVSLWSHWATMHGVICVTMHRVICVADNCWIVHRQG